jgi:hypothetical protein
MDELEQFRNLCDGLGGRIEHPGDPQVHVCRVNKGPDTTELALHEDTGGAMMIRYEGEWGEEVDVEANLNDAEWNGQTLNISSVDGHVTPEGGYSNYHRNMDITMSRRNFEVSQDLL